MKKVYKKINEEFDYDGNKYIVVESCGRAMESCNECDLFKYCVPGPEDYFDDETIFLCAEHEREDKKEVHFKKIEK